MYNQSKNVKLTKLQGKIYKDIMERQLSIKKDEEDDEDDNDDIDGSKKTRKIMIKDKNIKPRDIVSSNVFVTSVS